MGKGGNATPMNSTTGIVTNENSKHQQQQQQQQYEEQQHDFYWSTDDEPHATRRKLILSKYPEIKALYGHDITLKYKILCNVIIQLFLAYTFRYQLVNDDDVAASNGTKYSWFTFLLTSYIIGGTCNHMCLMGLHELSHNLGFKSIKYNQYYAVFVSNLPIAVPSAITFKRYHMDHHKYQGVDGIDVDLPTFQEGQFFHTTIRKFFFIAFQVLFYSFRPLLVHPKPKSTMEIINIIYILSTNALITYMWGFSSLFYLLTSTFMGTGLHPCAGHFIAEHCVFPTKDDSHPETYSYYGIVNYFNFNVGYHNEHHDFPFIPGSRLPKVKQIAAEFYDPLPHHTSYVKVMYDYITMPNVTAFSRVKRTGTVDDPEGVLTDNSLTKEQAKAIKSE